VLLMDFSISSKWNVSAFQATFFEMLSAWSASFLADMMPRMNRSESDHVAGQKRASLYSYLRIAGYSEATSIWHRRKRESGKAVWAAGRRQPLD
jgi:hypothetical protein